MALSVDLGNRPNSPASSPINLDFTRVKIIRLFLVTYLCMVVILHIATMPEVFRIHQSACEPGQCFAGQLTQDSLDQLDARGISPMAYATVATIVPLLIPILGHALAAVAIWQRPTHWLPVLFVSAIALCTISASGAFGIIAMQNPDWERAILAIHVPIIIAMPLLTLLFPTGKLVPKWGIIIMGFVALDIFSVFFSEQFMTWPTIFHSALDWWLRWIEVITIAIIGWRLHVTTDRLALKQTRVWFASHIPMLTLFIIVTFVVADGEMLMWEGSLRSITAYMAWAVTVLINIIGFLIAIYLYNVYDLSVAIRRSLVYGLLTFALVAVYLLTVAVLSTVLHNEHSAVPTILATAAIAIAFAPLRDWLQGVVRRLLYGDEDDPYSLLSRFGRNLEQTSAPERLLNSVVDLAQDSLRVPGVALAVTGASNLNVNTGTITSDSLSVPIRYQGDRIGDLYVSPRGPGESFSAADRRLIDEIARQTGIAVHSILLSEDLRQSRERIVTAREEERRRIRRDLHDGLGPSLAALSLQVEIARDLIATEPERSSDLLNDVLDQTRESILDIRRLVYDLRPPALDDLGLLGAIRAHAQGWTQSGLNVDLDLPESLPSLSAAVEVAIYRIIQESLNNVVKHADADNVTIAIWVEADHIAVNVSDDGQGLGEHIVPGVGMTSLRERAAELGGACEITSTPGKGAKVSARFAIASPHSSAGDAP